MFHGFTFDCDLTVVVHALSSARSVRRNIGQSNRVAAVHFSWVLPSFTGFYRVWLGFTAFDWVWLSLTGFYRVLLGFTEFYWVLPGFIGFYWVLLGFTWFYWVRDPLPPISSGFFFKRRRLNQTKFVSFFPGNPLNWLTRNDGKTNSVQRINWFLMFRAR